MVVIGRDVTHTAATTKSDPPYRSGHKQQNAPHEGEAFGLHGGYMRFAMNDGLRFANPSDELIRLTVLSPAITVVRSNRAI